MRYFPILLILFTSLLWSACESQGTKDQLEIEVMAIHDSIMPEMPVLHKLKTEIEAWIESDASVRENEELILALKNTYRDLAFAEDEMWRWMHEYEDRTQEIENADSTEKEAILLEEKSKIIRVKELMEQSISIGDSLLQLKVN